MNIIGWPEDSIIVCNYIEATDGEMVFDWQGISARPKQHLEVHPTVIENLSKLDCACARRALKGWFTRGEQDELIRRANCKKNPPISAAIRICMGYGNDSPFLV